MTMHSLNPQDNKVTALNQQCFKHA